MTEIKGITLQSNKYKNNDAIVNILTEDSVVPVIIRGAYSKGSKNLFFTNPLIKATFELYEGGTKYYKLRNATDVKTIDFTNNNFDLIVAFQTINEFNSKFPTIDNFKLYYILLNLVIDKLSSENISENDIYKTLLIYISFALKFNGLGLDATKCSNCGNKDIHFFSFIDSAFLCSDCANEQDLEMSNEEISLLNSLMTQRYSFLMKNLDRNTIEYKEMIKFLIRFIEIKLDAQFKCFSLF